jgi:O-acetyl-ADP-ribose deacetylase (regulator of RNase III)
VQKQRTYLVGKSQLTLEFGDITTSKADVLVSSDDAYLSMGGGVSQAILRAAGRQIITDSSKMVPAKLGDVVLTTAGALNAKYIFHAVTIGEGTMSHDEIVKNSTHQCIRLMVVLRISSIAFPAIGSGFAGFTLETVASTMADVIVDELRSSATPLSVTIYLFDRFGKMQDTDYFQFFEEVAVRTRALTSTIPAPQTGLTAEKLGLSGPVERVLEPNANSSSNVQIRKIFLASSSELKDDRREFEIFINRRNANWVEKGVFLRVVAWEDFFDAMSKTRLQDEYNREIRDCDVFVMLFWTKVGPYTNEEFETAFGEFKKTERPFVFTYFKSASINDVDDKRNDLDSLFKFKDKLKSLGHYQTRYENIHDLKFQLNQQLDRLYDNGFARFPSEP